MFRFLVQIYITAVKDRLEGWFCPQIAELREQLADAKRQLLVEKLKRKMLELEVARLKEK